jgi:hypothetical protein
LDKVVEGSTGPTLGQGRGKDQSNDPRTQTEEKYHTNPRTSQRDAGDEEDAGKTYHCSNTETRVSGSTRATTRMGSRNTRIGRRR